MPSAVLLTLLAATGSAGLLCTLCRRRGGYGARACPVPGTSRCPSQDLGDKPTLGTGLRGAPPSQRPRKPHPKSLPSATLPDPSPIYSNELQLAEVRASGAGSAGSTGRGTEQPLPCPTVPQGCGDTLTPRQGGCGDTEQDAEPEDDSVYTNTLCQEEVTGTPCQQLLGEEVSCLS